MKDSHPPTYNHLLMKRCLFFIIPKSYPKAVLYSLKKKSPQMLLNDRILLGKLVVEKNEIRGKQYV